MSAKFSLTGRLFLLLAVAVVGAGTLFLRRVIQEVQPVVQQSTEEALVDTANLVAEMVAADLSNGTLQQGKLAPLLERFGDRRPKAKIWDIEKTEVSYRVYVVDAVGRVVVDSTGKHLGADFSRWNDVYRTLRGQYGARSTRDDPNDESSSVMYVAAPVYDDGRIVGAVSIGKPNHTVQPYIERARRGLTLLGASLLGIAVLLGGLLSFWLSRVIGRLTAFAAAVAEGQKPKVPDLPGRELNALAEALHGMRERLDGKAYVERYVETLTHELKTPLAAIQGARELLEAGLPEAEQRRFLGHIELETERCLDLCERMLRLAQLEQRREPVEAQQLSLRPLLDELAAELDGRAATLGVALEVTVSDGATVWAEPQLLQHSLHNLLDNALAFTPPAGRVAIELCVHESEDEVRVSNEGSVIPDYALPRLTERFYSLPRPRSGRKSTGLGLSFVKEALELWGGRLTLSNVEGGVRASLFLPRRGSSAQPARA